MLDPSEIQPYRVRPLRRKEYDQLVLAGAFEEERVELIDGMLLEMSPQGTQHSHVVTTLTMRFAPALVGRALVRVQQPLGLGDDSEPEPDLSIVPVASYQEDHPGTALLVVEVAMSSLRADRLIKARLYARHRIPEYWIVNLTDRVVEVYRDPQGEVYRRVTRHAAGDTIAPAAFPDVELAVADLIP